MTDDEGDSGTTSDGADTTADASPPDNADATETSAPTQTVVSTDYKVRGKKPSSSGTGVLGHNTATSGTAFGVEGVTDSLTDGAAGIRGVGTATSGGIYGVLGLIDSPSGVGVVGAASDTTPLISFHGGPTGVWGHTDKSGADADVVAGYGVFGYADANSGQTYGVTGRTDSPDGYGVYGITGTTAGYAVYADGDAKVDGRLAASIIALPPHDTVGDDPRRVRDALGALFDEPAWAGPRYTAGPSHGEGSGAFMGAALASTGEVVFAPYQSDNVGVYDPATDTYTAGPSHGEGFDAFAGAALAPTGKVVFAP